MKPLVQYIHPADTIPFITSTTVATTTVTATTLTTTTSTVVSIHTTTTQSATVHLTLVTRSSHHICRCRSNFRFSFCRNVFRHDSYRISGLLVSHRIPPLPR
eukprot:GHVS01087785.1.p1 GENE.GHVS01087785.1~~GHVS01087785.1.p1  ORF type:complete len:102 (-),score=8.18 GHVS01087785.1:300-605(-)